MKSIKILKLTFIAVIIGLLSGISTGVFLILLEKAIYLNLMTIFKKDIILIISIIRRIGLLWK